MSSAKIISLAKIPQVSPSATNADLSIRTIYPSIYRMQMPDAPAVGVWFLTISTWGWSTFAMYYDNEYGFGMVSVFDDLLTDYNGTMVDVLQGSPFRLMREKNAAEASNLVDKLIMERVRALFLQRLRNVHPSNFMPAA
jgi:hypothetical protein